MRSFVAAVVLLSLALCQGCAGAAKSVVPQISTKGLAAQTETPLAAGAFADSIGVNLHMSYRGTPYDTDFARWGPILSASGIKHVRDAICPYDLSFCRDAVSARMNSLANSGIRVDLLTSLKDSARYDLTYVQTMHLEGTVEAVEGANECDGAQYCPGNWKNIEAGWQKTIFALRSPQITVIGPSMVSQSGYATLGNLSSAVDVGNIHDYVGAEPPETQSGPADHLSWASAMTPGKPVWATEMGYSTDPRYGKHGVPAVVQERYISRMLLEHLRRGIMRTYIYQLFDYGPDEGAYMGLLNADYSPKPAWTRLKQLIAFFNDAGTSPRTPLKYTIENDTSGRLDHVLFQRSDGTYLLAIWLANSTYDTSNRTALKPSGETVSIALPAGVTTAGDTQFLDNGAVNEVPLNVSGGRVSVQISSLVSVLSFKVL